ncbi:hypothetical protein ACFE04_018324 [Oxalis oulophora]
MMTACGGSLHHIFEKTLPENPTLIQSLSTNQIKFNSFADIFGEPHFGDRQKDTTSPFDYCPKQSDNLQMCTEGLGSESSGDVDDLIKSSEDLTSFWQQHETKGRTDNMCGELKRSRTSERKFPPPISSIGQSGKPGVYFKSYRRDGRFILKEVRVPTQDFLHAQREDGRLTMHFVHSTDDILEEEEDSEKEVLTNIERKEGEQDGNNGPK